MPKTAIWIVLATFVALPRAASSAEQRPEIRETARAALAEHGAAIITVELLLTQRYIAEGRERNSSESTLEIAGTVLNAAGLTVVSDAASNPGAMSGSPPGASTRLESETGAVRLVLADGREVPAHFVLRDSDLDLAFLMPDEPLEEQPHVGFQTTPLAQPLDDLILLFPMAKSLNRQIGLAVAPIRAVLRKPRDFLVMDTFVGLQGLGCPAFDSEGRAIGLIVMRRSPIQPRSSGGFRDMFEFLTPVVLTSADVLEVAEQAISHANEGEQE